MTKLHFQNDIVGSLGPFSMDLPSYEIHAWLSAQPYTKRWSSPALNILEAWAMPNMSFFKILQLHHRGVSYILQEHAWMEREIMF